MNKRTPLRATLAAAALAGLPLAMPVEAAIVGSSIETTSSVSYVNDRDGVLEQLVQGSATGSFTGLTRPVFTSPSGAPFDTFGAPARLASAQSVFGFNSVAVEGAFSNGAVNELSARAQFSQQAEAEPGDIARLSFHVFPGQIGITCFAMTAPTTVSGIVDACHPSFGTSAEVYLKFSVTRGISFLGSSVSVASDFVEAGLRIEVLEDTNAASGTRVDVTQLGSTLLTYNFGLEDTGTFAPLLVLNIDSLSGVLDAGMVDTNSVLLGAEYAMRALITVSGVETGARARIADPFALQADPIAYFQSQFPGAPLPGFILGGGGGGGGGVDVPAPTTMVAGLIALLAARRTRRQAARSG